MRGGTRTPLKFVVSSKGDLITVADLPSPLTKRWVVRRKEVVVLAVLGGLLGLEEACRRYALTKEEFHSWAQAIEKQGVAGLRRRPPTVNRTRRAPRCLVDT